MWKAYVAIVALVAVLIAGSVNSVLTHTSESLFNVPFPTTETKL